MSRADLIRRNYNKSMHLIEIGPSYNPIVPKADGWKTTVIDHANQADLIAKYSAMGLPDTSKIEPVDFVWHDADLTTIVPERLHGTFDGIIASHVGEHLPDLIGFFESASELLKAGGTITLALPDKRGCFDFFQPITMAGEVIDAYRQRRRRHRRSRIFNHAAYHTHRQTTSSWLRSECTAPFELVSSLAMAQAGYDRADENPDSPYTDTHAWIFTPKSFELLILELNLLRYIDWAITTLESTPGNEFYVWLEKKTLRIEESQINPLRISLLQDMVRETAEAAAQFAPSPAMFPVTKGPQHRRPASVAVIIPLYNGSRYIEEALLSVIGQSRPANEILVVNDGSTDGNAGVEIVERLARDYPITLVHKANGGQSSARNLGVARSTSDLIAFLDQDDIWYENHLEELRKPFAETSSQNLGWVYANLDEVDEHGRMVARSYISSLPGPHPKRHLFDCIRQDMYILPSASMIHRTAFEAVGGFDEQLCGYEDDDLFLRMFREGYDNEFVDKSLSKWRIYPGSTSYTARMALSRSIYARKLLEMFPDDEKRCRYYARDLIAPRFFEQTLGDFIAARKIGDKETMATAWGELAFLTERAQPLIPRLFRIGLDQYRWALAGGTGAEIDSAWKMVSTVAGLNPRMHRSRAALGFLRNRSISKRLFAFRSVARPAVRWAFDAYP